MKSAEQWVEEWMEAYPRPNLADYFRKAQAEALAEHMRVLDECETALKHCATHHFIGESGDKRTNALAAIAKLKGKQG